MVYKGNLGFIEMLEFVEKATPSEQIQMDKCVAQEDWDAYKALINKVLNTQLK